MKKLLATILTLGMTLSIFGCSTDAPDNENSGSNRSDKPSTNENMRSVWLVSKQSIYFDSKSTVPNRIVTFTYNDQGLPLQRAIDIGLDREEWNEEIGVYELIYGPVDGTINQTYTLAYNDFGDIVRKTATSYFYDENGNLTDTMINSDDYMGDSAEYCYDSLGRISSVNYYIPNRDESGTYSDEVGSVYHLEYDRNGNLIEVNLEEKEDGTVKWVSDYRYDSHNRLIGHTYRTWYDGLCYYQYEYNMFGKVSRITLKKGHWQSPIDSHHVAESTVTESDNKMTLIAEVIFEYDSSGNLISRKRYDADGVLDKSEICTYTEDGKLSNIICSSLDYEDNHQTSKVVYSDADYTDYSADATFIRDNNGNVIKIIHADGSRTEFEYIELKLSEADASKCRSYLHALNSNSNPIGYNGLDYCSIYAGHGYVSYIPWVESDLYQFDIVRYGYGMSLS